MKQTDGERGENAMQTLGMLATVGGCAVTICSTTPEGFLTAIFSSLLALFATVAIEGRRP